MKKWLKKIIREAIREETELHYAQIFITLKEIEEELEELNTHFPSCLDRLAKQKEMLEDNIPKVNGMLLELKGVVSVARGALADRKAIDLDMDRAIEEVRKNIINALHTFGSNYFVFNEIRSNLK